MSQTGPLLILSKIKWGRGSTVILAIFSYYNCYNKNYPDLYGFGFLGWSFLSSWQSIGANLAFIGLKCEIIMKLLFPFQPQVLKQHRWGLQDFKELPVFVQAQGGALSQHGPWIWLSVKIILSYRSTDFWLVYWQLVTSGTVGVWD